MSSRDGATEINPIRGNATVINNDLLGGSTHVNHAVVEDYTEVNDSLAQETTSINSALRTEETAMTALNKDVHGVIQNIDKGTVLLDKYIVEEPLKTNTGEARLYVCSCLGNRYVAKIYRRVAAIKDSVLQVLKSLDAPNVARVYDTGEWNGFPVEIIPYYAEGSLEYRKFSYEQLRDLIIPALNEGLHVLHQHDIIHKDMKPSNIMLCDDRKNVAIIDFGISSVREGGNTVVVTQTGMTPEYSAPETFRNLFLEESDYYSLGVTIYTLFCGHTPYAGADRETIEKYISIQKIPFPNYFPDRLKELVIGLTYIDITNRKDKTNPNRRWTYDEVKRWCKGELVTVPGGGLEESELGQDDIMPPITFMYNKYTRVSELVEALARDWFNGKKRLYRSTLTNHFKAFNQDLANYCMDAEEWGKKDRQMEDVAFFQCLYRLNPYMKSFYWMTAQYESMERLGLQLMEDLRSGNSERQINYQSFMENHLFSIREKCVSRNDEGRSKSLRAVEDRFITAENAKDADVMQTQLYIVGYLYSGMKEISTPQGKFSTVDELIDYVKSAMNESEEALDALSDLLIRDDGEDLMPEFHAWLIVQGKGHVLDSLLRR